MTTAKDRLVRYLDATGWLAPEETGPTGGLWRHPESDLLLPVPHDVIDAGIDWQRIVERIAAVEETGVADVLQRLAARMVDIANLRAANDIVIKDTIPYSAGVTMVRESWTMLRAAATTSLGTRGHIRRFRKTADEIVEQARMAHTKRGSFIIPIYLPLPETAEPKETIPGIDYYAQPETRERRVMRTFAQALSAVEELVVRPEREPSNEAIHELVRVGASHEFTRSLHRVLAEEAVSEFSASFSWAVDGGPTPPVPDVVTVPSTAQERVKRVAQWMRTEAAERQTEYLTGPIVGIHRNEPEQDGTVTVQVSRNARLANVSVNVSADLLVAALDWMKEHETVSVESRVHRTTGGLMAERRDALEPLSAQYLRRE